MNEAPVFLGRDERVPGYKLLASGKVRDIYELDARHLLFVTTDRVSAFDVVMREGIPWKGRVLTAISAFWFEHTRDVIEKEKDAIYSAAAGTAKERLKLEFLMRRIAEKEEIKVSQEEILRRVQTMAAMYQIPPEKFVKDLQKRNGFIEIYDQLAQEKVLEFLQNNAQIEAVAPSA